MQNVKRKRRTCETVNLHSSFCISRWHLVINIPILLDRFCYRYPSLLVDAIAEHEAGRRLVAVKNVTVNEEFFQGHFPGAPLMPGVLMLEALSQVAAILLLQREEAPPNARVYLRGVNDAKFRRQVVPGDRLRLEISLGRRRAALARAQAVAYVGDQIVAEAELLLGVVPDRTEIDPTAIVHPRAQVGEGTIDRSARDDRRRTCASARTAGSARRRSSTAGPRSATTRRSIRSPRSASCRRT